LVCSSERCESSIPALITNTPEIGSWNGPAQRSSGRGVVSEEASRTTVAYDARRWRALSTLLLAPVMDVVDLAIVTIALPTDEYCDGCQNPFDDLDVALTG